MPHESTYVNAGPGRTRDFEAPVLSIECQHGRINVAPRNPRADQWDQPWPDESLVGGEAKDCGGIPVTVGGEGRFKVRFA